jgi:hypothetical protein
MRPSTRLHPLFGVGNRMASFISIAMIRYIAGLRHSPARPVAKTRVLIYSFLFSHYSHATYVDRGEIRTVRFPSAVRAKAARCKLPFALRQGLSQESKSAPRRLQRKDKGKPPPILLFRGSHEGGVGRNSVCSSPPAPSSSASPLLSSSRSLRSHSDVSLCASSSAGAGTSLPTSVERKSKIG